MREDELRKQYPSDETGMWHIFGEDPNCDLGGHHHNPDLGIYTGKYSDIVDYALELPNFFSWGSGGYIKKVEVKKINKINTAKRRALQAEKETLEKRLEEIEKQLERLE